MRPSKDPGSIGVGLNSVSHAFQNRQIFTPLSGQILPGTECLIRGANGSGKSTLGRIVAGELSPSEGAIEWTTDHGPLDAEGICHHTQRVSPATSLHPILTPAELIEFQGQFRAWRTDPAHLLRAAGLGHHLDQPFQSLSSGMQQRVKLALALACQTGLIVLDEPCANLDESGKQWYREALQELKGKTTLVVCSNDREEDFVAPDLILNIGK